MLSWDAVLILCRLRIDARPTTEFAARLAGVQHRAGSLVARWAFTSPNLPGDHRAVRCYAEPTQELKAGSSFTHIEEPCFDAVQMELIRDAFTRRRDVCPVVAAGRLFT